MDSRLGGGCVWSAFGDQAAGVWPKKFAMESSGSGGDVGAPMFLEWHSGPSRSRKRAPLPE